MVRGAIAKQLQRSSDAFSLPEKVHRLSVLAEASGIFSPNMSNSTFRRYTPAQSCFLKTSEPRASYTASHTHTFCFSRRPINPC